MALFAAAASLFAHAVLALVLGSLLLASPPGPASAGKGFDAPVALITDNELTELARVDVRERLIETSAPEDPVSPSGEFDAPIPEASLASLDMTSLSDLDGAGSDSIGDGLDSAGAGGGAGGGASFFGVEARGSRFAYIVDVSGSMAGERLAALKRALYDSIDGLLEHAHFTVVFYNQDALPLTGDRWARANDLSKAAVKREIAAVRASGGTEPIPAFRHVFSMQPRPDAVYFMTDADFGRGGTDILQAVVSLNERGRDRTPVHCITFIERGSEEVMRRIARLTGGSYKHVGSASP